MVSPERRLSAGHVARDCPTNGDATYDVVQRKHAKGIPKAFLKKVGAPSGAAGSAAFMTSGRGIDQVVMVADECVANFSACTASPILSCLRLSAHRVDYAPRRCTPSCS